MSKFFTNYPDTDFHELNLDWLLNEWQTYREQFDGLLTRMDTVEAAFKDLQDFVTNYFDNLDVQDEINNKLNDMFDNGELQVLLQRVIDNPQVMDLTPVLSISKYRGFYDRNAAAANPAFLQAACTDGANMYMFFMNNISEGEVIIQKWSLSSKELLATATIMGYHGNGADYYDGTIYLATMAGGIVTINPQSLTVTSRHTFDITFRAVTVDNDGTIYGIAGDNIYTLDLTNNTYDYVSTINIDNADRQSGIIRDGWFYDAGVNPACMYKINVQNGMTSKVYPIDRYVDQYPVGEVESVVHNRETGELYIVSCAYWGYTNYYLGQIFKCYLTTNTAPRRLYNGGSYEAMGAIYIDQNNTNGLPDGSQTNPFTSLSQAMCAFQSPYRMQSDVWNLTFLSDCPDEPLFYRGTQNINITGNGYTIPLIYFRDATLSVSNLHLENNIVSGSGGAVDFTRPFYALFAEVHLDNVTIDTPTTSPDYALFLNSCVGSIYNLTLPSNLDIQFYRSNMITNQGLKERTYYTNDNQRNMAFSQDGLASATQAQIHNIANCDLIILRVVKSSIQTFVQFPVDDSHVAQCFLRIGINLECYSILSTKVSDGVFRFSVQEARRETAVGTWETTTDPVLAGVYFFSMS